MPDFPLMFHLQDRPVTVIGGGAVALRRVQSLVAAGAQVTVIAPSFTPQLVSLPVKRRTRPYTPGDLAGAVLVFAATDDPATNAALCAEARQLGIPCNRADSPEEGDFSVPAHRAAGPILLSVSTSGISPHAAAAIRDQLLTHLDPDWPRLLETIEPLRRLAIDKIADPAKRREMIARFSDEHALAMLKARGPAPLEDYCRKLIAECCQ